MKYLPWLCCVIAFAASQLRADDKPAPLALKDGDRVVFVGNDFFEREANAGYIETALTLRYPKANIIFRNLGYSGDTVWADARTLCSGWDAFGPEDQGFERLKKLITELKPTVIVVAYGMNESFAGKAGLDHFVEGLNRMLDMLASTKARLVLLSPIAHENLGAPYPDPSAHNEDLRLYVGAMEKVATDRNAGFINLFHEGPKPKPLTSDGIHPTPDGYWRLAQQIPVYLSETSSLVEDARVNMAGKDSSKFVDAAPGLPPSPEPGEKPLPSYWRGFSDLPAGTYTLREDGRAVATATAAEWGKGVQVVHDTEQVEALRAAIVKKNADFFHYWRPENDTYVFGYRNHEQGRNAPEVPKFLPLVEEDDKKIAELRVPKEHTYTLTPEH